MKTALLLAVPLLAGCSMRSGEGDSAPVPSFPMVVAIPGNAIGTLTCLTKTRRGVVPNLAAGPKNIRWRPTSTGYRVTYDWFNAYSAKEGRDSTNLGERNFEFNSEADTRELKVNGGRIFVLNDETFKDFEADQAGRLRKSRATAEFWGKEVFQACLRSKRR